MFSYSTIQSFITQLNGSSCIVVRGFGMYSFCNTSFYVMDHNANKVYILNDNWAITILNKI